MGWEKVRGYAELALKHSETAAVLGRPLPQTGADNAACVEEPETTTTAVFDIESARLRAALTIVQAHPVSVTLDDEHARLVLAGGGCDGNVLLDGSMQVQPN